MGFNSAFKVLKKVTFTIVRFSYWNSNFLDRFSKDLQIPNFMKIRAVEAEMLHAE